MWLDLTVGLTVETTIYRSLGRSQRKVREETIFRLTLDWSDVSQKLTWQIVADLWDLNRTARSWKLMSKSSHGLSNSEGNHNAKERGKGETYSFPQRANKGMTIDN